MRLFDSFVNVITFYPRENAPNIDDVLEDHVVK